MMRIPTIAACLLAISATPSLAQGDLTGALGLQLEREIRHRSELPAEAQVHIAQLRIANDTLAARARSVQRVELPLGEDGLGRVAARALLQDRDGSQTWTWVQARVDASAPTVVATRTLARGAAIASGDVELAPRPVSIRNVTKITAAVGRVLKRTVRAGEPMRSTWLAEPLAVRRGDQVEIVVRRGVVTARGTAEAIEHGSLGDVIRLRRSPRSKLIKGRITGQRRVEVIR